MVGELTSTQNAKQKNKMTIDDYLAKNAYYGDVPDHVAERLGKVQVTSEVHSPMAQLEEIQIEATYQGIFFQDRELEAKVTVIKEAVLPKFQRLRTPEHSIKVELNYKDSGEEVIEGVNEGRLYGRASPFESGNFLFQGYSSDLQLMAHEFFPDYWTSLLKQPGKDWKDFVHLTGELIRVYAEAEDIEDVMITHKQLNFATASNSMTAQSIGGFGIQSLTTRAEVMAMTPEEFREIHARRAASELMHYVHRNESDKPYKVLGPED